MLIEIGTSAFLWLSDLHTLELRENRTPLTVLHAAYAKIARTSGAVEYLKETFRDTQPISVVTSPNAAEEGPASTLH